VDSVETEAHAVPESARSVPQREPEAPDFHVEQRPSLERLASGIGNRGMGQLVARMGDGEGIMSSGLVHPDVQAAIAATRGGGAALDRSVGSALESSMGALGDIRIHTDDGAAALSRAVSARAFTVGSDIYFARGEYRPGTPDGNELIAHEVAHTVQQQGGTPSVQSKLEVSAPGDAAEVEADRAADAMTRGERAQVSAAPEAVHRDAAPAADAGVEIGRASCRERV